MDFLKEVCFFFGYQFGSIKLTVISVVVLFFGFEAITLYAAAAKPSRIELSENWKTIFKAQLAHYENARSQFESYAACGWASHKMVVRCVLSSCWCWCSFCGNLIDYYMSPGGVYFGAKKKACGHSPWFSILVLPVTTVQIE